MRHTRLLTLTLAAVLAATMTAPALAQDSADLTEVDRAMEAARQAVELAADFSEEGAGSETPDPGGAEPGAEDPDTKCKSNNGKSDRDKADNGKSNQDKPNNGKSDNSEKVKPNNGKSETSTSGGSEDCDEDKANDGRSGKPDKAERLKGRERAAEAIAAAMERGNGNGNGFGRGHSAEVIDRMVHGDPPHVLEDDESHGAKVSAMVKAYNELRKQEIEEG